MGFPIYFAFLHITAERDDFVLLGNVNKCNLLFTLGLNLSGNHACVQSEGIAIYLIVDSFLLLITVIVHCSFLCFLVSLDDKSFEAETVLLQVHITLE